VVAVRRIVVGVHGSLGSLPAHELGKVAIMAALQRAGVEAPRVSEVILGQILTAGEGQNPARQASIAAGIPVEIPAWGVNQLCGSGLRTVALGFQAILAFVILFFSLLGLRAANLLAVFASVVVVGGGGWLFYKLVRVLSRIQMPTYPGR